MKHRRPDVEVVRTARDCWLVALAPGGELLLVIAANLTDPEETGRMAHAILQACPGLDENALDAALIRAAGGTL